MKKKFGFTLAEILITLGIIGVVSAMTMSVLINNYNKKVTAEKLKKSYSELSQTLKMAETEYGSVSTWDLSAVDNTAGNKSEYFYNNFIKPYLKVVKYCKDADDYSCWAEKTINLKGTENSLKQSSKTRSFITASGYSVIFWVSSTGSSVTLCIDINGPQKGPNKIARDIFYFGIWFNSDIGLKAYGVDFSGVTRDNLLGKTPDSSLTSNYLCSKGKNGVYCSGVIVLDGWKIEKDYPW